MSAILTFNHRWLRDRVQSPASRAMARLCMMSGCYKYSFYWFFCSLLQSCGDYRDALHALSRQTSESPRACVFQSSTVLHHLFCFFYPPFFFLCQTHVHTPRCPLGQSKIPFWPFCSVNLHATSQLLPLAAMKDNTITAISQLLQNPGKLPHLRFIGAHFVINRLKPIPRCSIDSSRVYLSA